MKFVKNAWAYHKNLDIKVDQIGYMYSKQVVMVNFSTSKSNFQNFGQKVTPPYCTGMLYPIVSNGAINSIFFGVYGSLLPRLIQVLEKSFAV